MTCRGFGRQVLFCHRNGNYGDTCRHDTSGNYMISSFRQRYAAARNRQATDWWTATFADPVSWLVLGVTAEWPLLTPHRITVVSFVFKAVPAALLILGGRSAAVASAVLLQVGQVLDSMDGNLAGYRGASSRSGGFLEKIPDGAGFVAVEGAHEAL